ncbi:MAG: hypothetical protein R3A48_26370 [Polyangiales bacterium]
MTRWLLLTALAGCAATVDGTASGDAGGAAHDADVPAAPRDCAWRPAAAVEVSPPGDLRYRLVDAAPTPDGAWVTYRARRPGGDDDELFVTRVTASGEPHPGAPLGSVIRAPLFGLAGTASLQTSMLGEGEGLTMLFGGETDRGACVWARLAGPDTRAIRSLNPSELAAGFTLTGCGAMLRTAGGYSFVSEQVRALWGTTLLELDEGGGFTRSSELPMTAGPTQSGVSRVALPGGDFLGSWVEAAAPQGRMSSLNARRFSERGEARGDTFAITTTVETLKDSVLTLTAEGVVALWEGPADRFPASDALLVRALSRDGRPVEEPQALTSLGFFLGGLSAAARGDELLATAITARDGMRLELVVMSARGALRAQVDTGLRDLDGPLRLSRVTATREGALVFATVAQGERGGRVVAVPMRCE